VGLGLWPGPAFRKFSRMHFTFLRWVPVLTLIIPLAGCWGGGDSVPPPQESVVSHFVLGSSDQIQTTIVDVLPAKAAVLRLPDGQNVAAAQIDRERNVYSEDTGYGPDVGVGVAGGSNGVVSSGIGFGFPLFGGGGPSGTHTGSMTTSTIRFKVPDMAAYRRDWQHYVLHVDLDDGANRRAIETLPPAPPQD
jgi:hypothetical protein